MKVLIVNNMAPFIWGGAEELAVNLQKNLNLCGHQSEILRIPFQYEPASSIPSQMLMVRAFELYNVDHVIALKFPAYMIRHPKKTLWLLHQYRQAYDLFDVGQTNLPSNKLGEDLRKFIYTGDNENFQECKRIFTNSEVTRQRLLKYNGFESEVLLPPINDPEIFSPTKNGDYIFVGGRINDMKRQHLVLSALKLANKNVKLLIAGPPDTPADAARLLEIIERFELSDRVKLDLRFLPRETYAEYMNNSLAVAYLPFDEDSLGYVSMEGAIAGKPLLTTTDSGGILGLVKDNETGWVAEPTNDSLAEIMNKVWENKKLTEQYGVAAKALWNSLNINWLRTVEKLLE